MARMVTFGVMMIYVAVVLGGLQAGFGLNANSFSTNLFQLLYFWLQDFIQAIIKGLKPSQKKQMRVNSCKIPKLLNIINVDWI